MKNLYIMNMTEIWKDIEGFEGLYQVSNYTRVRTVERIVQFGNRKRLVKSIILKQTVNKKSGYVSVMLSKEKVQKRCYVHRLVAQAFIPNPDNLPEIDHINRIKTDNRIENLRWVDRSKQLKNRDLSTITKHVIQLTLNNEFVNKFDSISEASNQTGINDECIRQCYHGKRKTAGGYKWVPVQYYSTISAFSATAPSLPSPQSTVNGLISIHCPPNTFSRLSMKSC